LAALSIHSSSPSSSRRSPRSKPVVVLSHVADPPQARRDVVAADALKVGVLASVTVARITNRE
jgi:hypothetical protein